MRTNVSKRYFQMYYFMCTKDETAHKLYVTTTHWSGLMLHVILHVYERWDWDCMYVTTTCLLQIIDSFINHSLQILDNPKPVMCTEKESKDNQETQTRHVKMIETRNKDKLKAWQQGRSMHTFTQISQKSATLIRRLRNKGRATGQPEYYDNGNL